MTTGISEKTKTDLKFVAVVIIPVTMWLTGLSYMIQDAKGDIEKIQRMVSKNDDFQRDIIDRLARIESKLEDGRRARLDGDTRGPRTASQTRSD